MVPHVVGLVLALPAQMLLQVDLSSSAFHSLWVKRAWAQARPWGHTATSLCSCICFIDVRSTLRINCLLFRYDMIQATQSGCPLRVSRFAFAAGLLRHLLDCQRVRHHVQMVHIVGVVAAGRLIVI